MTHKTKVFLKFVLFSVTNKCPLKHLQSPSDNSDDVQQQYTKGQTQCIEAPTQGGVWGGIIGT